MQKQLTFPTTYERFNFAEKKVEETNSICHIEGLATGSLFPGMVDWLARIRKPKLIKPAIIPCGSNPSIHSVPSDAW
jgi:hypothetical protein